MDQFCNRDWIDDWAEPFAPDPTDPDRLVDHLKRKILAVQTRREVEELA